MTTASADLWRALAVGCEPPDPAHAAAREALGLPAVDPAEYTEVFVHNLYPYAAVYLSEEGMLGGEAADRVAGFWRAMRLAPPAEPDHLAVLLGLYATLTEAEQEETEDARAALWRRSRKALLWEHLLSWVWPWLGEVQRFGFPASTAWARTLREALRAEASELGPLETLPLHMREAPPLRTPDEEEDFLRAVLAPVRSGMIFTRRSLARGAHQMEVGLRIGERRFVLEAMFSQDPATVLSWLADHARVWVRLHIEDIPVTGQVARFWRDRAEESAELFDRLREDAATVAG